MSAKPITRASLEARARKLAAEIKSLPLAEKFRMVADFIDTNQIQFAHQTATYALRLLGNELAKHSVEERAAAAKMNLQ